MITNGVAHSVGPLLLALALGLSNSLAAAQRPSPVGANEPELVITLPMELLMGRPIVRVKISDKGPFALLVDPPAESTAVDQTLSTELELKFPVDRTRTSSPLEIQVGASKMAVSLTDMARLVPDVSPTIRPRGVLSAASWPNRLFTIDYPHWQVVVEQGALSEPNSRDVFSLDPDSALRVTLTIGNLVLPCRLDPAFAGRILLPQTQMGALQTVGRTTDVGSMATRTGRVLVREVQLATDAVLGRFTIPRPIAQFTNSEDSCVVGSQLLRGFLITYDINNARVQLALPSPR